MKINKIYITTEMVKPDKDDRQLFQAVFSTIEKARAWMEKHGKTSWVSQEGILDPDD